VTRRTTLLLALLATCQTAGKPVSVETRAAELIAPVAWVLDVDDPRNRGLNPDVCVTP
jgi:hypothetical protein